MEESVTFGAFKLAALLAVSIIVFFPIEITEAELTPAPG